MSTKNFGLPTGVSGYVALKQAVDDGFEIIDEKMKELEGGQGGTPEIAAADITDATTVGRSVLTAANAAAARAAIGAGTSSFSGSFDDLEAKPTIPAAPAAGTAAQLSAGTDTTLRTRSAKMLADEIDRRIAAATPPVE